MVALKRKHINPTYHSWDRSQRRFYALKNANSDVRQYFITSLDLPKPHKTLPKHPKKDELADCITIELLCKLSDHLSIGFDRSEANHFITEVKARKT